LHASCQENEEEELQSITYVYVQHMLSKQAALVTEDDELIICASVIYIILIKEISIPIKMQLGDLATELVVQVFFSCASVQDVHALSSTCYRFHKIYTSSQRLNILETVCETQFGPLHDLSLLLTHHSKRPAHVTSQPPLSLALLGQIVRTGRVAEKWCEIYPFKKWKHDYENRRCLNTAEQYRLRRAIYRLWLYSRAFHNHEHIRQNRAHRPVLQRRANLLHNWNTWELAEIADANAVIRDVVHSTICPSNGTVARKARNRYPQDDQYSSMYHRASPTAWNTMAYPTHRSVSRSQVLASSSLCDKSWGDLPPYYYGEGWGDEIPHYYVIEDMLKLDPGQILWLKENAPLKGQVECFVKGLGDWFENNGETWGQTLEFVLAQRGEDGEAFKMAIECGDMGVALEVNEL
jgi:hypothetical protein